MLSYFLLDQHPQTFFKAILLNESLNIYHYGSKDHYIIIKILFKIQNFVCIVAVQKRTLFRFEMLF